jgi:NADH-quinone oxidoreductase subunit E
METAAQTHGFEFTPENEEKFQALLPKYPTKQAVVLPALWLVMEQNGYITLDAMNYVAKRLDQPPVSVYAVVEFYTMFHTSPVGKHHIQMCRTITCTMRGYEDLVELIRNKVGIGPGEKTKDGMFSFELVECLGSCGTAPMMRMDNRYFENLNADKLTRILDACIDGRNPAEAVEE